MTEQLTTSDLEGYDGPAHLVTEGTDDIDDPGVEVEVRLRGMFVPIDGRYHWYGRVGAGAGVDALVGSRTRLSLRTPHGEAPARLADRDPWGRYRITGTGRPPFPVQGSARRQAGP